MVPVTGVVVLYFIVLQSMEHRYTGVPSLSFSATCGSMLTPLPEYVAATFTGRDHKPLMSALPVPVGVTVTRHSPSCRSPSLV